MFSLAVALILMSPDLPAQCQAPATRDVLPLAAFAQMSGSLSVGLDSVATWCFDASGGWTGGSKKAGESATPTGDCDKAIKSCERARAELPSESRQLLYDALSDLERPFQGATYRPKRSGLAERPSERVDCLARNRSALFSQAQARMDMARLASQTQNEYVNYKTWLYSQGLKCAQAVGRNEPDALQKGVAVDKPNRPGVAAGVTASGPQTQAPSAQGRMVGDDGQKPPAPTGQAGAVGAPKMQGATAQSGLVGENEGLLATQTPAAQTGVVGTNESLKPHASSLPVAENAQSIPQTSSLARNEAGVPLGGPTAEREKALSSSMLVKWRYFQAELAKIENDIDWATGFLVSRELRDCRCRRPVPSEIVHRLEGNVSVAQLEADDAKNSVCALCVLDSYPRWKVRSQKQCSLATELTEFELEVLQKSDDGNGFPPRCAEIAKRKHMTNAAEKATGASTGTTGAYVVIKQPEVTTTNTSSAASDFVRPNDYAPIPAREDGRVYLRVFTSSACVAEVLPGPVQARTGDLLPIPPAATEITVRGPCGGIAEIYFGREEKPRIAESFAKAQPLRLQFRAP